MRGGTSTGAGSDRVSGPHGAHWARTTLLCHQTEEAAYKPGRGTAGKNRNGHIPINPFCPLLPWRRTNSGGQIPGKAAVALALR